MIHLLCGMIGSGKSSYARKLADDGWIVVCHDDLTEMLHARYRYEQGLRDMYREMEMELAIIALEAQRKVVIDRTHLTRESRERWVNFARNAVLGQSIVAVIFPIEAPEVHAQRRFESDPRGRSYEEWLKVAQHHHAQAMSEPLDWKAEGFTGKVESDPWPF